MYAKWILITSLIFTPVLAHASAFDRLEVSYGESDPYGLELEGPKLTASISVTQRFFVGGSFGDFSGEAMGLDVDSNLYSVRAGYRGQASDSLTLYAGPELIRGEYTFQGEKNTDSGQGIFAGFVSQATDNIEILAEASITRLFDVTNVGFHLGGRYYFAPRLSFMARATVGHMSGYEVAAAWHF